MEEEREEERALFSLAQGEEEQGPISSGDGTTKPKLRVDVAAAERHVRAALGRGWNGKASVVTAKGGAPSSADEGLEHEHECDEYEGEDDDDDDVGDGYYLTWESLESQCEQCNEKKRASKDAQDASQVCIAHSSSQTSALASFPPAFPPRSYELTRWCLHVRVCQPNSSPSFASCFGTTQ